jgi:hypothetical protein
MKEEFSQRAVAASLCRGAFVFSFTATERRGYKETDTDLTRTLTNLLPLDVNRHR